MTDLPVEERFRIFVADQTPAIDELRTFCGGELASQLDLSVGSLQLLDEFVRNLTAAPEWDQNPLFEAAEGRIRPWLTVRVAYYLAAVIVKHLPGHWRLHDEQPVLDLECLHILPLDVAHAFLQDELKGGLSTFYADLTIEAATDR